MHVVTSYPDGLFSWVDLMTTDPVGAKAFYGSLFGWDAVDIPVGPDMFYSMMQIEGKNVAGMGPMQPDMQASGMPPVWASYVNHGDVDAVAARVTEAGGQVIMPPVDVFDSGRMAMFQDPTGAVFGVWQPRSHIGAQLVNMPSTLVWNELQTHDLDTAKTFYAHVFGWTNSADPSGYVIFANDGRMQAGMMKIDESWGEVPPNWSVYFMVEDVEATAARAQELGGSVLVPPTAAGDMGRFSVLQDPQGGAFTVMQFSGPVDPPPGA